MAIKPDQTVEAETYRCPGCGQIVDGRRMEEVRQHHQHLLLQHRYPPAWFNVTADASRSRSEASRETENSRASFQSRHAAVESPEVRLRRYGH